MTVSIFVDEHRNAAMLVCDEPIYALGPVIVADSANEAAEALEAFVGALERPADELPTVQLITEWTGFLAALHGIVMGPKGELVEQAPPPPAPDTGAARNGDVPDVAALAAEYEPPGGVPGAVGDQPPTPDATGPEAGAHGPLDDDDQEGDDEDDVDLADRLAHVPGGTPAQRGEAECWNCGGTGEVALLDDPAECGVCKGSGRIPSAV